MARRGSTIDKLEDHESTIDKPEDRGSTIDKLEDWLDDTEERLYKAAVQTGRRRSSLLYVNAFTNFMKGIQDDHQAQGFEDEATLQEMEDTQCRKPLNGSKTGTLKEKNDLIMSLVNTVEKKTEDIGVAWEHYGSANPAYSVIPSYRNEKKSLPEGSTKDDAYSKEKMDDGMNNFETQFDGLIRGTKAAANKLHPCSCKNKHTHEHENENEK